MHKTLIKTTNTWIELHQFWKDVVNPSIQRQGKRLTCEMGKNDSTGLYELWVHDEKIVTYVPFKLDL